jgi:hypothetical protein
MKEYIIIAFVLSSTIVLAQTPDEIMSWLPEIDGWQKPADKEVFDPDNLFDRINGAAPLFIENGFQEMTTADYKQGDDYITIQVYRHDMPDNAFGMYSSERSPDLTFYPVGGEAHGDNESFFFFNGPLYVKIRSNKSSGGVGEAMKKIAEALVANSGVLAKLPAIFDCFPQENKSPNTETFITSNFIGHEFLNKVYHCKYVGEGGMSYQLFVIDANSPEGAKEILNKYFAYTEQPLDFKEGVMMIINDKYNGDIPCLWKGKYITGLYNENGDKITKAEEIINRVKLP